MSTSSRTFTSVSHFWMSTGALSSFCPFIVRSLHVVDNRSSRLDTSSDPPAGAGALDVPEEEPTLPVARQTENHPDSPVFWTGKGVARSELERLFLARTCWAGASFAEGLRTRGAAAARRQKRATRSRSYFQPDSYGGSAGNERGRT